MSAAYKYFSPFCSLSSSDWEDAGEDGDGLDALQAADEAGVHADDEQSDWPGAADDDDNGSFNIQTVSRPFRTTSDSTSNPGPSDINSL